MKESLKVTVAVVGIDSAAGKLFVDELEKDESLDVSELFLLDSAPDEYDAVRFRGRNVIKQNASSFDFSKAGISFFFVGGNSAAAQMKRAESEGSFVVDASGSANCEDALEFIAGCDKSAPDGIKKFVSPDPVSIQTVLCMKPIADRFGISELDIVAMRSVSERGQAGLNELAGQTASLLNGRGVAKRLYPAQIAFNVIPSDSGAAGAKSLSACKQKVASRLGLESGRLYVSEFDVPVFYGNTLRFRFRLRSGSNAEELMQLIRTAGLCELNDDGPVTPVENGVSRAKPVMGRIFAADAESSEFVCTAVMDNTVAGNASNCIAIGKFIASELM